MVRAASSLGSSVMTQYVLNSLSEKQRLATRDLEWVIDVLISAYRLVPLMIIAFLPRLSQRVIDDHTA